MIVCVCRQVSDAEIIRIVRETGATSIDELQFEIQICDTCCVCSEMIEEIIAGECDGSTLGS